MAARLRRAPRAALLPLVLLLALALAACGPEDDRERGDGRGSGADPDNRDASVEMHGDEPMDDRIYYHTPNEQPDVAAADEGAD